jgi:hypothetical protein
MIKLLLTISVMLSLSLFSYSFADTACNRDCEPPTLGVLYTGQRVVESGFSINEKSFSVAERTQTIPTTNVKTGQPVNVKLVVYENSGVTQLRDVSLSIGNYEDDRNKNVLATLSFKQLFTASLSRPLVSGSDVSKVISIEDTSGLLQDVSISAFEIDSYRTAVDISFKVLRPLETSDIIIQTMDAKRGTGYNIFYDAIKVNGKEITQKTEKSIKIPPPPLKQLQKKISLQKIECREGLEKITRNNGAVACVSTYTADMLRNMGLAS